MWKRISNDLGGDPAALEGVVDDGALDVLDGDGRLRDAQHARTFARRGAHAPRELCGGIALFMLRNRYFFHNKNKFSKKCVENQSA